MSTPLQRFIESLAWGAPERIYTEQGARLLSEALLTPEQVEAYRFEFRGQMPGTYLRRSSVGTWLVRFTPADDSHAQASFATNSDIAVPAPPGKTYAPYQLAGIAYAMARPGTLIGDEMGLGKTIQAIGVINYDPAIKRVLIVCPASLRLNWRNELRGWLVRDLTVGLIDSKKWTDDSISIVSYDSGVALMERLRKVAWDLIVFDEAHYLKNPTSRRAKSYLGWFDKKTKITHPGITAKRALMLTGTPFENRPKEIFGLAHYLAPRQFPNYFRFGKRFCAGHQKQIGRDKFAWDFDGASNQAELQELLRATIMIRRSKAEVLADLPPKRRSMVEFAQDGLGDVVAREADAFAKLDEARAQLEKEKASGGDGSDGAYQARLRKLREQVAELDGHLFVIRHENALRKVPAGIEHLNNIVESDPTHKVIVFAHHRDVIDQLRAPFLDRSVMLVGGMSVDEQQEAVRRFQEDPGVQFMFGGIQAAGVGHTMTAASHVIFFEFPWDPGKLQQAEDRAHRRGQRESVLVEFLVIEGSVDIRQLADIMRKQADIDATLNGTAGEMGRRCRVMTRTFTPEARDALRGEIQSALATDRFEGVDRYLLERILADEMDDARATVAARILHGNKVAVNEVPGASPAPAAAPVADPFAGKPSPAAAKETQSAFNFAA